VQRLLLIRGGFAVVLGILAVVAFTSGEEIFGALLAAFAITNLILIGVFSWHRARSAARPPAPPARRPH
jgi:hypothetical protein